MKRFFLLAAATAALVTSRATAHEAGGDRAMGTVERVTEGTIVIRAADGHSVAFALTPETRFSMGDRPARREDVRIGQRAVVHGKREDGKVEAVRVRLGARPGS